MNQIELTLPMPPSVNTLYAWKKVRYKSDKYKEWTRLSQNMLLTQDKGKIIWDEWLESIIIFRTNIYNKDWSKKKKDVDNYLKALLDFLWDNIEWFDDSKIKKLSCCKIQGEQDEVDIIIREI